MKGVREFWQPKLQLKELISFAHDLLEDVHKGESQSVTPLVAF
jgi:hypothetical protein